jgi:transcriptional regulator with XRE-family HTH domain
MRAKDIPGTDRRTNDQLLNDIAADEKAIVTALRSLREQEAVSLEEIGFVLGVGAGQISRYLNGSCGTTLKNYLRIARALGYRCRVVFERQEDDDTAPQATSEQKISPHKVLHAR